MTAVAGTRFTGPWLLWLSQACAYCLMLITAEYPWGCGWARRLGLRFDGVPDACSFCLGKVLGAFALGRGYLHVYVGQ